MLSIAVYKNIGVDYTTKGYYHSRYRQISKGLCLFYIGEMNENETKIIEEFLIEEGESFNDYEEEIANKDNLYSSMFVYDRELTFNLADRLGRCDLIQYYNGGEIKVYPKNVVDSSIFPISAFINRFRGCNEILFFYNTGIIKSKPYIIVAVKETENGKYGLFTKNGLTITPYVYDDVVGHHSLYGGDESTLQVVIGSFRNVVSLQEDGLYVKSLIPYGTIPGDRIGNKSAIISSEFFVIEPERLAWESCDYMKDILP